MQPSFSSKFPTKHGDYGGHEIHRRNGAEKYPEKEFWESVRVIAKAVVDHAFGWSKLNRIANQYCHVGNGSYPKRSTSELHEVGTVQLVTTFI
jgi:hypothetical protein